MADPDLPHNMEEKGQEKIVWTIGHSTRTIDEFIALLKAFKIGCVADIRSLILPLR
jgi:hypothetical protein